jgi:hypothetical protein
VIRRGAIALTLALALALAACGGGEDDGDVVVGNPDSTSTTASTVTTETTAAPTPTSSAAPPTGGPTRDPDQRYRTSTTILEGGGHGPQLCLGGIAESYPPQCGGPDVIGWSWDAVGDEESVSGTTWVTATVVGTYEGTRFTLTEPPGPPGEPDAGYQPDFSPACENPEGDPTMDRESFRQPEDPDVAAVWVSGPESGTSADIVYSVVVRPGAADRVRELVRQHWDGLLCIVERDQPTRTELEALQSRTHVESPAAPIGGYFYAFTDETRGVVVVACGIADEVSQAWVREHWGEHVVLEGLLEPV